MEVSLANKILAEIILDLPENDMDLNFVSEAQILECLESNKSRINLKTDKFVAIFKTNEIMQVETFNCLRQNNRIDSQAVVFSTQLLERKLDEKIRENGFFQYHHAKQVENYSRSI